VNFDFFMQNLLFEKILLPRPPNSRGDYPIIPEITGPKKSGRSGTCHLFQ
jgi:hypothetical protein